MFTVFCLSLCISPHRLNSTGLHLLSRVWWDCPHYFWQVLHFFYSFAVPFSLFGSLLTLPVSEFSFCLTKAAIFYLYTSLSYLLPPTQHVPWNFVIICANLATPPSLICHLSTLFWINSSCPAWNGFWWQQRHSSNKAAHCPRLLDNK